MCVRTVTPTWAVKMLIRPSYDFFVSDPAVLMHHRTDPHDRIFEAGPYAPEKLSPPRPARFRDQLAWDNPVMTNLGMDCATMSAQRLPSRSPHAHSTTIPHPIH